MKKWMLLAVLAASLVSVSLVSKSCGPRRSGKVRHDTLVVNTTELCRDTMGYHGPTPLSITLVDGVVTSVEALPNEETPRFFERVVQGGLLEAVVGKTAAEAAEMPLDAVTGATFSSRAVIANLRAGLREARAEK